MELANSCTLTCLLSLLFIFSTDVCEGFYVQPDVLYLSEHPLSQQLVEGSNLSLSCGVQLRGLSDEEGGLNVPVIWWNLNHTRLSHIFPEAVELTELSVGQYLRSTLRVAEVSLNHSGTYHCHVEDGTDRGSLKRLPGLCRHHPCLPLITASHPATISVLGNSMVEGEEEVELERCSSVLLQCGSLLPVLGLRPELEWNWDGVTLNGSSSRYAVLANDDLVLYASDDYDDGGGSGGGVEGYFQCTAWSDSISATVASYAVNEVGGGSGVPELQLEVTSTPPVAEGHSFSIYLSSSGVCLEYESLSCLWTRNGSSVCSEEEGSAIHSSPPDRGIVCGDRVLTVASALEERDSGRYCCQVESDTKCIDVEVKPRAPPLVSSPHNGTTLTTAHSSPLTLTCAPSQSNTSLFWLSNGAARPEWNGLTEISVDTSSVGVYQCFVGNQFGHSVVTLRVLPDGLTNPPGIPHYLHEVPRPDSLHRPAYLFSWQPPTYPDQIDSTQFHYSLSTFPDPTLSLHTSTVAFISHDSYASLFVSLVDLETGMKLSERSPAFWRKFNDSKCYKLVYFPPLLTANCGRGQASPSWSNNPYNIEFYPTIFYNLNGKVPGLYYISITCYLQNGTLLEVEQVYTENGSAVFEDLEGLPVGTECVFGGAASPSANAQWPSFCLHPDNLLHSNTSCHTTAYVEFERRDNNLEDEGAGFAEICLNSMGTGFSLQLVATYEDNTTEVVEVEVTGDRVCVSVDLRDDEAVNEARNISLTLQTEDSRVTTGPPVILTSLNDDVARVFFAQQVYEVEEGRVTEICVRTDTELQITVHLNLTTDGNSSGRLDLPEGFTLGPAVISCLPVTTHDNDIVDESHTYKLTLTNGGNPFITTSDATLTITNNDVARVFFAQQVYEVEEGRVTEVCVRTDTELQITVHLSLTTDGNSSGRLDLPEGFTLGPAVISCLLVTTHDNDIVDESHTYKLTLTNGGNPFISTSDATLTITNNDVVSVGFVETQYEVEAGEVLEMCVLATAPGRIEKPVSVHVTLAAGPTGGDGGGGAREFVELDREMLQFSSRNETSCVSLNTSSAVGSPTLLEVRLDSADKDVSLFKTTAYVSITPARSVKSEQPQKAATGVIVWSVVVPLALVGVAAIIIFLLLVQRYRRRTGSFKNFKFPEEPWEYRDYEPPPIRFGSVPTLYEGVVGTQTVVSDEEAGRDLDMESLTESRGETGSLVEVPPEREEEREGEEGEGEGEDLPPEARTTSSSLESAQSPCQSVCSGSQHEYIASDSMMLYSHPPSVAGGTSGAHSASLLPVTRETETLAPPPPTHDEGSGVVEAEESEGLGGEESGGDAGESGLAIDVTEVLAGGFRNLLSDVADLTHATVGDSGIDMDTRT